MIMTCYNMSLYHSYYSLTSSNDYNNYSIPTPIFTILNDVIKSNIYYWVFIALPMQSDTTKTTIIPILVLVSVHHDLNIGTMS